MVEVQAEEEVEWKLMGPYRKLEHLEAEKVVEELEGVGEVVVVVHFFVMSKLREEVGVEVEGPHPYLWEEAVKVVVKVGIALVVVIVVMMIVNLQIFYSRLQIIVMKRCLI